MSSKEEPSPFSSSSSPITLPDTLNDPTITFDSASGSFHSSDNILYNGAGSDLEFGVTRPEFRQLPLVGSVQFYDRHVFLCYKNPRSWPPRIEAAESDRLPRLLSAALAARKPDFTKKTYLTICEGRDGTETSNGDVLIFPDMIRYRRLTHFDVDTFVEVVLIKNGEWLPGNPEKLKGSFVFVCCHGSHDRRCGVCGPPLVNRFKDEVEAHGLQGKVSVSPCSHVGGHEYAGNVIIFGSSIKNEVTGHWYGYVTPDDIPHLLEQHIVKGEIVEGLWRGQMGLLKDDQHRAQELGLQNTAVAGIPVRQPSSELPEFSSPTWKSRTESNACCLTNAACCQHHTSVENEDDFISNRRQIQASAVKKGKKQLLRNISYKGAGKRKVCSMPSWHESWEDGDTYAALAVACAAFSVGIAYRCYKQL